MVCAQEFSQNLSLMLILTMYFYTYPYMPLFRNLSYIYVKDGIFIPIYLYIYLPLTLCTPKQAVCVHTKRSESSAASSQSNQSMCSAREEETSQMAQATTCSCCTAPATELKTLSVFTAPRNNEPVIKEMDGQLQQMTDGSAGSVSKGTFGFRFFFQFGSFGFFPNWRKIDLTPTPNTANLTRENSNII